MKILSAQKDKKNTPTLWIVKSIEKLSSAMQNCILCIFLYFNVFYFALYYVYINVH